MKKYLPFLLVAFLLSSGFAHAQGKRINVKSFGAVGNGSTDDMRAIQKAIDNAGTGDTVYFPEGTYIISPSDTTDYIGLRSNVNLSGVKGKSIIKVKPGNGNFATMLGAARSQGGLYGKVSNVTIKNLTFNDNYATNSASIGRDRPTRNQVISLFNFNNITIDNCIFNPISSRNGLAFNSSKSSGVTITNCDFNFLWREKDKYYDNSTVYLECSNYKVQNNSFRVLNKSIYATCAIEVHGGPAVISGNTISDYEVGINLSSGYSDENNNGKIICQNNDIKGVNSGILLWAPSRPLNNVLISKNIISIDQLRFKTYRQYCAGVKIVNDDSQLKNKEGFVGLKQINIIDNTISFEKETGTDDKQRIYGTGGLVLDYPYGIDGMQIRNNKIVNSPSLGITMQRSDNSTCNSTNVVLANNNVVDAMGNPASSAIYKSSIILKNVRNPSVSANNMQISGARMNAASQRVLIQNKQP
jgi:hypothetical protein